MLERGCLIYSLDPDLVVGAYFSPRYRGLREHVQSMTDGDDEGSARSERQSVVRIGSEDGAGVESILRLCHKDGALWVVRDDGAGSGAPQISLDHFREELGDVRVPVNTCLTVTEVDEEEGCIHAALPSGWAKTLSLPVAAQDVTDSGGNGWTTACPPAAAPRARSSAARSGEPRTKRAKTAAEASAPREAEAHAERGASADECLETLSVRLSKAVASEREWTSTTRASMIATSFRKLVSSRLQHSHVDLTSAVDFARLREECVAQAEACVGAQMQTLLARLTNARDELSRAIALYHREVEQLSSR